MANGECPMTKKARMTEAEIQTLPVVAFGAVRLDPKAGMEEFNQAESSRVKVSQG